VRSWLCNAARIEADLGKLAARLTRRALATFSEKPWITTVKQNGSAS
jgi:hypothetical protein